LKMPTSDLATLAAPGGSLYGIQFTNNGRIVIFGGGVPLYDAAGNIVGGLGVSGGTEAQDTALAQFGAKWFADNIK
ncbi:MAG: heme-binding protein, partial [Clostridia bacterium]|nr:heme-binding protein [Clostridia bacterium]